MAGNDWMSVAAPGNTDTGTADTSNNASNNAGNNTGDNGNVVTNYLASQVVPPAATTGPTTTYSAPNGSQLTGTEQQIVQAVQKINPQLDPMLAVAIARSETANEDPNAVSPKGAKGIMQVMPSTRANLIAAGKLAPDADNITAGVTALSEMAKEVDYNPVKLLAYYNGGKAGVNGASGNGTMPTETAAYVPKVSSAYQALTGRALGNSATIAAAGDVGASAESMHLSPLPGIQAVNAIGDLTNQVKNFTTDFLKQAGVIKQDTDVAQKADIQYGQAAAQAETDKQTHMQEAADLSANHQDYLGTNSKDAGTYIMNGLFSQLRNAALTQAQNLDAYNKSKQESFWDNPLQHIKFAVFGNDYAKKANASAAVVHDIAQTIQEMSVARQDQDSNDVAATNAISKDMAADAAKQQLARATATAAAFGVQGASAIMGAESHMTLGLSTAANAATQMHSLQVQSQTTATANKAATTEETIREQGQKDQAQLVATAQKALGMIGADGSSVNQAWIKLKTGPQLDILRQIATKGVAGNNPAEAGEVINKFGNPNKLPDQAPVAYRYFAQMYQNIVSNPGNASNPSFNKKDLATFAGPKMMEQISPQVSFPDSAPLGSPYHIASPKVMLQHPEVTNTPIAKVILPLALTGRKNVSGNDMLNTALDAAGDGHITPEDAAAGLANYYQQGIALNNKMFHLGLLGAPIMQHYYAHIDGMTKPVDMINKVDILHALTVLRTKQDTQNVLNMFE